MAAQVPPAAHDRAYQVAQSKPPKDLDSATSGSTTGYASKKRSAREA